MPVLTRRHATIHTAAIDVKIMRLDKKQVTLSVFRQLPCENIFLSDGTLRGTPWGLVRYNWKDSGCDSGVWVVWQKDEVLFRCPLPKEIDKDVSKILYDSETWDELCNEKADLCYRIHNAEKIQEGLGRGIISIEDSFDAEEVKGILNNLGVKGLRLGYNRVSVYFESPEGENFDSVMSNIEQGLYLYRSDQEHIEEEMDKMRERLASSVKNLGSLDQLFIAV